MRNTIIKLSQENSNNNTVNRIINEICGSRVLKHLVKLQRGYKGLLSHQSQVYRGSSTKDMDTMDNNVFVNDKIRAIEMDVASLIDFLYSLKDITGNIPEVSPQIDIKQIINDTDKMNMKIKRQTKNHNTQNKNVCGNVFLPKIPIDKTGTTDKEMNKCVNKVNKLVVMVKDMEEIVYDSSINYNVDTIDTDADTIELESSVRLVNFLYFTHVNNNQSNCNGNNDVSSNGSITIKVNNNNNNNNKYCNILNNLCIDGAYVRNKIDHSDTMSSFDSFDELFLRYGTSDCGKNKDVQGYGKTNIYLNDVISNVINVSQYSMGEFGDFIIDDGG